MNDLDNHDNELQQACWVTWEIQVRNRSMATLLNIPLYELISSKHRVIKYPILIYKTLKIIFGNNIKTLFVQNPSIVLSGMGALISIFTKKIVVIDAHNAGIFPLEGKSKLLNGLCRFISKYSTLTIVSNANLQRIVQSWGAKSIVVPDPIPKFDHVVAETIPAYTGYAFFICTWADDEPYHEVIKAAKLLPPEVKILITGRHQKKLSEKTISGLPNNIVLLGFIDEPAYISLLRNALVAIDLTTRQDCLVCGAYESMALGIPCIISDSEVNRRTFPKGFLYTENIDEPIANSVLKAIEDNTVLRNEIRKQKHTHTEYVMKARKTLLSVMTREGAFNEH